MAITQDARSNNPTAGARNFTHNCGFKASRQGALWAAIVLIGGCGSGSNSPTTTTDTSGGQANNATGGTPGGGSNTVAGGGNNAGGSSSNSAGSSSVGGNSAGGTSSTGGSSACCTLSDDCNACLSQGYGISVPLCENLTGNDPIFGKPNVDLCKAVLGCVISTKCFDSQVTATDPVPTMTATTCYCGDSGLNCLNQGAANGACKQQIETGLDTQVPTTISLNFTNLSYPAGVALYAVNYGANHCSDVCTDFLSPDFYNSTGGSSGTGGATGTGGAPGTGGVMGAGGSTSTSAGGSSAGGTSVSGCPTLPGDTIIYDFKDNANAISVNSSKTTSSLNLTYAQDGGVAEYTNPNSDGGAKLADLITWDGAVGMPNPGSVMLNVPYSAPFQTLALLSTLSAPIDLTGKTLFACVRLDAGLYPSTSTTASDNACASAKIGATDANSGINGSTTSYICPSSTGQWIQLLYQPISTVNPVTGAVSYDTTQIGAITLQIFDGTWVATSSTPVVPATLHVDTIGYR